MNAPWFPTMIRNSIHECAPDHSVDTITLGALRKAADDIASLYTALELMVAWHGKRNNHGDDTLLPPDQQEHEVALAMGALEKATRAA